MSARAVVGVADGAMIREMKLRIAQILRRVEQRIRASRDSKGSPVTHVASDHDFEFSGSGASTESVMQERGGHSDNQGDELLPRR